MTEENTKPEWEKKYDELFANLGGYDEHEIDKITPLALHFVQAKDFIRSLLASQRHQLKEQVLAIIGKDEEPIPSQSLGLTITDTIKSMKEARNNLRSEIRQRIEAVFEKEV